MSAARTLVLVLAGLALIVGGLLQQIPAGLGPEFAGLALLLWTGYVLAAPLAGPRVCYRVRYHYPATAPQQNEQRTAALLGVLARRGGRVSLYWRREGAGLELYIALGATVDAAFRGMLLEIWPGAVAERIGALPVPPGGVTCLYLVAGKGSSARIDFATIFTEPPVAPAALWLHMTAAGSSLLAGAAVGASRLGTLQLRAVPGNAPRGTICKLAMLYPFVAPWPARAGAAKSRNKTTTIRWPRSDALPSLDVQRSLILPPLSGYEPPALLWTLGRAAAGNVPIGLDLARPGDWGHVLLSGGTAVQRQGTALRLLSQAAAAGWSLVALDHSGRLGKQLYELAPAEARRHSARIDLHARRGNMRLGLLDVAPRFPGPGGQAEALRVALETRLPAYLRFLGQLGLPMASLGPAGEIAPADVTVQLLAHYRARLSGMPAPALPEVPALYSAWASPRLIGERVQLEIAAWASPASILRAALAAAGTVGAECARRAEQLLRGAERSLVALDLADLQLYSASLRARLAPAATSPLLRACWAEMVAANSTLDGAEAPLVLANLGYGDSSERGAARVYGLYLLALFEALAQERALVGHHQQMVLAWDELAPAWSALKPADIYRLGKSLRQGGVHLVVLDQGWIGLNEAQAVALRTTLDNWVIGAMPAGLAGIGAELRALGVPGEFSLSALPPGHALVRCQAQHGPMFCTAITAAEEGNAISGGVNTDDQARRISLQAPATAAGAAVPVVAGTGAREAN